MKWLGFTLLLFTGKLLAQAQEATVQVDPVSSEYLIKVTLGLFFIVLLIFGLAWFMKRMQWAQGSQRGLIRIVSAISVGHRDRIALVQVGDEQILVGMTPGRMQTLHTLKTPLADPNQETVNQGFTEHFKNNLKQVISRESGKN